MNALRREGATDCVEQAVLVGQPPHAYRFMVFLEGVLLFLSL